MTNQDTAFKILDYLEEILAFFVDDDTERELRSDIEFHTTSNVFLKKALHTYSIHGNAVSYIDKITEESIPTLSIVTCVFSEIATPMPLKLKIKELPNEKKSDSHTLQFEKISEVAQ